MSTLERMPDRNHVLGRAFSVWHRARFHRTWDPMVDRDWTPYCLRCSEPLGIVELKFQRETNRDARVNRRLSERAEIPFHLAVFTPAPNVEWLTQTALAAMKRREQWVPWGLQLFVGGADEYVAWERAIRSAHVCRQRAAV